MLRTFLTIIFILLIAVLASAAIGPYGFNFDLDMITSIRAPRIATALFTGATIAIAGALSQALFRNALATPSILGTEAGASFSLAAATLFTSTSGTVTTIATPYLFTTFGAAVATLVSLSLVQINHRFHQSSEDHLNQLLLGGFALNAILGAGTALCISILMERGDGLSLYHWLMGSFTARTWTQAGTMGLGLILGLVPAMLWAPRLDVLSLGQDSAQSLGINIHQTRFWTLGLIAALVGCSLSCGGALPFVGLIAPHLARMLLRPHLKTLIPLSALLGGLIAVTADILARTLRAPVDMDVGILTTMIGAPYFLWLLAKNHESTSKRGVHD
jgi:iron complex transport system permease protein